VQQFRQPEVEDLQPSVVRHHEVAGFQVAMHHSLLVCGCQSFSQLDTQARDLSLRQGSFDQLPI
jgi:hypothetical protein